MKLPDYPVAGEPMRASWGRQVIDYLRSITPRAGLDVYPEANANGTTYRFAGKIPPRVAAGFAVEGTKTLYKVIALREYTEDGVLVAVGSESSPLATGHTLKPTWDWTRAHA